MALPSAEVIEKFRNDPVAFVEFIAGNPPPPWQADFLRAIANGTVGRIEPFKEFPCPRVSSQDLGLAKK